VRLSKEILSRAVEAYRKIRNTLRYLLANLYDFDPQLDQVERSHLEEVDRYILARYADVAHHILNAYDNYDYGTIFQALNGFTTVDLSAFYADVSKDRLYTFAARSRERRSAQTAMYMMADGLTRLMTPILSFTADELWRFLPGRREESVHMAMFPARASLGALMDRELLHQWGSLTELRERVLVRIEPLRKDKQIGSSLQARVVLSAAPQDFQFLKQYELQLPMLLIVSDVTLHKEDAGPAGSSEPGKPGITIERAGGVKCERCWRYVTSVSSDPVWAGLCERCQDALAEPIHG
jgi:isoleucyl-tRNA synthetase